MQDGGKIDEFGDPAVDAVRASQQADKLGLREHALSDQWKQDRALYAQQEALKVQQMAEQFTKTGLSCDPNAKPAEGCDTSGTVMVRLTLAELELLLKYRATVMPVAGSFNGIGAVTAAVLVDDVGGGP